MVTLLETLGLLLITLGVAAVNPLLREGYLSVAVAVVVAGVALVVKAGTLDDGGAKRGPNDST